MRKIVIGADPWGLDLKKVVEQHLRKQGYDLIEVGMTDPKQEKAYYDIAVEAARKVQAKEADCGILFCGTGMGVAIVANKFKGIVASVVESEYAARMCRAVNNANILTMGGMFVAPHKAILAVDAFLSTKHTEGLEDLADFLRKGIRQVARIEEENLM